MRAYQTAEIAVETAGWPVPVRSDERLRDRELGILDMLTAFGVETRLPQEAERRRWLGKFYYRPPGGESWADVALRLRSVIGELNALGSGHRVMLVCHDAVVLLFRYVLEGMSERELLDLAAGTTVLNASVTRYVRPEGPVAQQRWRDQGRNGVLWLARSAGRRLTAGGHWHPLNARSPVRPAARGAPPR